MWNFEALPGYMYFVRTNSSVLFSSCTVVESITTQTGKTQIGSKKPKTRVSLLAAAERLLAAVMAAWPTLLTSTLR